MTVQTCKHSIHVSTENESNNKRYKRRLNTADLIDKPGMTR
ncbi:hypothetical protein T03_16657 [Trichinella britovi]|uniref:Uncharacterized protein n=1 Tax=Trichinella britovi TaxID=45882 RepID=A0A0V0Z7M1_TRIBR|nr:hypothetical protein T03_16657 [Trichinella britovi]